MRSIGRYEILGRLSSGGMGEVLLARRRAAHGFEKLLAVKTIRADLRDRSDLKTMFLDEARLVARLDHPAIAQVFDFGDTGVTVYLVMEYVQGVSFETLMKTRTAPLPWRIAARLIAEACRGLHAAHELTDRDGRPLGVVHRDVSPQNLFLTFDGKIKLLDFGIAHVRDRFSPMTELGTVKGKPAYMAPEQVKCKAIDRRADVFAAGIVLHELLTAERLFRGESIYAVGQAVVHKEIVAPSQLSADIPPLVDEIVLQSLKRRPEERYQDALAMAADLEHAAAESGDASLDAFVARELAGQKEEHQRWLQSICSGASSPRARDASWRPEATLTILDTVREDRVGTVERCVQPEEPDPNPPPRRRPRLFPAAVVLLLLAAGLFAGRSLRLASRPAAPAAATVGGAPSPAKPAASAPPPSAIASTHGNSRPEVGPTSRNRSVPQNPGAARKRARPAGVTGNTRGDRAGRRPPVASEPSAFGFVTIGAEPYGRVRIDGAEIGTTPVVRRRLVAGPHELVLINPETDSVRHATTIHVQPNQELRLRLP